MAPDQINMKHVRDTRHRPAAVLETLEGRQLMSSVTVTGGVLTIEGNAETANRILLRTTTRARETMDAAISVSMRGGNHKPSGA